MLRYLAPILSLVLLLGYAGVTWSRPGAEDAEPYHARVRASIDAVPKEFDGWVGQHQEVPKEAIKLLQPNRILSRNYINAELGLQGSLLIVHCKQARDLAGHYPPRCYPSQGWAMAEPVSREWDVQGSDISGRDYTFTMQVPSGTAVKAVANVLVLPDGRLVGNMDEVYGAAADHARRHFGAAQVQVVTPGNYTREQRDLVLHALLEAAWPAIQTIRDGAGQ